MPYFPLYLAELGFDGWQIGVLIGMQPALRWGGAIWWAYVADRWRIRHRLLLATSLGGTLLFVPMLWLQDFTAVLATLGLVSLLHGGLIPMLDATVMDHLSRLGGDYGRLRLWGSLAFVVGALVSAPLMGWFSPRIVPLLVLVPMIAMVPAFARLPREQVGHGERFLAPWTLLTRPLTAFLVTAFLIQLSCGAWGAFFSLHTTALGFSTAVPGITWGLAVSAEVAMLFWGRTIVEHFRPAQLIIIALVATVFRWSLTAVARNEMLVIGLQLGHAFTFSAFHLAALILLSRLVPPQSSTGGQALYGLVAFGIGGSSGLLLAGALVQPLGTAGLFGFEAVIALAGLVPAAWLWKLTRTRA